MPVDTAATRRRDWQGKVCAGGCVCVCGCGCGLWVVVVVALVHCALVVSKPLDAASFRPSRLYSPLSPTLTDHLSLPTPLTAHTSHYPHLSLPTPLSCILEYPLVACVLHACRSPLTARWLHARRSPLTARCPLNGCSASEIVVTATPVHHTVPCVGFVIHELDKEGRLLVDRVMPALEKNREALRTEVLHLHTEYTHAHAHMYACTCTT